MSGERKKLGLALGAGGARGLAHLGVLQLLEEEGIEIDLITGTSIGSLIGGAYACGVPLKYMTAIANGLEWEHITDVTFPRLGLIKGEKLLSFLELITQKKTFTELDIPLGVITCDIENGEHVVINSGSLAKAIRASTSIPGIYVPFRHQGRLLVDGGILDRIPVSTVKKMGADLVIAVDVGARMVNNRVNNIFDVLLNTFDIMQNEFENLRVLKTDILIKPPLKDMSSFDLDKSEFCIETGYRAAKEMLPEIRDLLGRKG